MDDAPRLLLRKARKLVGLPASKDVGTLASVIKSLRALAEEKLDYSISTAFVTTPHLVALYKEDTDDALEYAGLKSPELPVGYGHPIHELCTSYAGYGLGLCQNYANISECKAEERSMSEELVLGISYTKSALMTSLSPMRTAYSALNWPQNYIQDFELGHDSLHNNPREEYYWESVRNRILELPVKDWTHKPIAKVLLLGESAVDATFLRVLEETLSSLQKDMPEIMKNCPVFAAAKGAAEFLKRSLYTDMHDDIQSLDQGDQMLINENEEYLEAREGLRQQC